ncbi:hypothetical protein [Pedobacter frigoris]|uniref:hypothetical protein n=1 Tax=Pedobacter frigoris TaxID=2571272 RepID=UPI00292D1DAA|nr:hypothetical protein [Pedobacter frigoris]
MKTILIPTDFNASALNCIPEVCAAMNEKEINIIFVHLFRLSDSITDLLMLSRRSREFEHVSDDFHERCSELKKQHPVVKSIKIEFFYGSTLSMFRNFLEANAVDCILHPEFCSYGKLNKASVDPSSLVIKSGLPTVTVLKKSEARLVKQFAALEEESLMAV